MNEAVGEAQKVLQIEADSILALKKRIDEEFCKAVDLLKDCKGKVIVTGIGKSGQIARKLASTFSSTGTPSLFLHPAESSHGDLGVIAPGDLVLAISYGGESSEMNDLIRYVGRRGIPMVALTGNPTSSLARASDCVLDVSVEEEACPLKLAPTSSSTAALAMGDALAMALLRRRGFKEEDFAEFHPGGSIGRKLLTRVKDIMHGAKDLPLVKVETPMREVITMMAGHEVRGVAGVVDADSSLIGVVTDGDIRRCLQKSGQPLESKAVDLMGKAPKTIDQNELAVKAIFMMEEFAIQLLFVVDKDNSNPNHPIGVINYRDLFKARLR